MRGGDQHLKLLEVVKKYINDCNKYFVAIQRFIFVIILLIFPLYGSLDKYNNLVFVVDIKGAADYESISNAVAEIKLKKLDKNIILIIAPGEYEEIVDLRENTNIDVLFLRKDDTKLIDKSGIYINSPLMLSGQNYIRNANIVANHTNGGEISFPYSYALHYDYLGEGTTIFENCRFESNQNSAVGIGMHENQTLIFNNCDFYSNSEYDGGTIYCHNSTDSGITNQKIILVYCRIVAEKGLALKIDDANIGSGDGLGNQMEIEFINCNFTSMTLGENCYSFTQTALGEATLSGNIKLSPESHGNNLEILNAK